MSALEDFEDVEIFIRPVDALPRTENEMVWSASYEEMARLSSHTVVEMMDYYELEPGKWRVGIREKGDEQYFQNFRIGDLQGKFEPSAELQNRVAAILNHWRG